MRFQRFPAQQVLRCEGEEAVKGFFMNSLKQALYLQTGSSQAAMTLAHADQSRLWEGMRRNEMVLYCQASGVLPETDIRRLPVRCILSGQPIRQLPVAGVTESGRPRTIGEVVLELLPEHFVREEGGDGGMVTVVPRRDGTRVMVQGVSPPLGMPALALWHDCRHPDRFLYIGLVE